jgi:hypothetical protein
MSVAGIKLIQDAERERGASLEIHIAAHACTPSVITFTFISVLHSVSDELRFLYG